MAQSKQEIVALLEQAGSGPRHRFGQNFMIDQNLVRRVAEAGELGQADWVIEVGPGTGTLTEELLARAGEVMAVEIDRDLAQMLRGRLAAEERFHLLEGDALAGKHALNAELLEAIRQAKQEGKRLKLVANLPYNIASPLVIELLLEGVELLAFTVQKEVADRLRAAAGGEAYGPLTVMAQLLAEVEVLRVLPPQAFWPMPKIESALVRLKRRDRLGVEARAFSVFAHQLFGSRRKMLRKALGQMDLDGSSLCAAVGVGEERRPEELTPEQVLALFRKSKG